MSWYRFIAILILMALGVGLLYITGCMFVPEDNVWLRIAMGAVCWGSLSGLIILFEKKS